MNESTKLVLKEKQLPASIPELKQFILVANEALKAYKVKLNAIDKLNLAKAVKDQTLNDGQKVGSALLWAEAKMGELLKAIPKSGKKENNQSSTNGTLVTKRGSEPSLPEGITKKQSHRAQQLFEHKNLINDVIAEAEENEDIPTRTEVLRRAKSQDYKETIAEVINTKSEVPTQQYRCIVIDPPWPIQFIKRTKRPMQIGISYPTMSIEEITKFNVQSFAHKDCHLYLWTTHSFLPYCFEIVKAWGFEYKCLMTWVKNVGMTPMSWMYSTEHVLFCTKGNLPLLKRGMRLDFAAKVREHSRKPNEFYELIKKASPEPRIDIFSREKRDGFDSWGKENTKFNDKLSK